MKRLILASTSPYRREILTRLGIPFDAVPPQTDETRLPNEAPAALATRLARDKAQTLVATHPGTLIVGSDQVASLGDDIFGKPGTRERGRRQLQQMRGTEVTFSTAVCLINSDTGKHWEHMDTTVVRFRQYSDAEIDAYLDREPDALHCAGSAKAEALGASMLEWIRSEDPSGLIGLPLIGLCRLLRDAGVATP